jgi:steroid delta-isomerase-like uncharacterized protein
MATNKLDLAKKHIEALTKGDWSTYRAMMSENAVYDEEATFRHADNPDSWTEISKAWRTAFPDVQAVIKESFASGDSVVLEVEWTGTHKGVLVGPMGTVAPTNRSGQLGAVLLLRFEGDRIRTCHHYFDLMTLLMQLGIAPQPAQASTP